MILLDTDIDDLYFFNNIGRTKKVPYVVSLDYASVKH